MAQPLSPSELQFLQTLHQRASRSGQIAGQPGPGMMASLSPPTNRQRVWQGIKFEQTSVYEPKPWIPLSTDGLPIGLIARDRTLTFTLPTVNITAQDRIGFSTPAAVYAITATAFLTDGAGAGVDLPVGADPRDVFRIQIKDATGDLWQSEPAMASNVAGTAQFPRLIGAAGRMCDGGTTTIVMVTPLLANLLIDVTLWTIEQPGPTNIAPSS
jgi:hypothetical protein